MRLRATRLAAYSAAGKSSITPTTWSPAQLSPILWTDASDGSTITLNGSTVSQWADKSGNGRNLVQATAAQQPAYNATTFNGRPGITFDGTDDILLSSALMGISGAAPRTFAYVSRRINVGSGPLIQVGTTTVLRAFGRTVGLSGLLYHWAADLTMSTAGLNVNNQEVIQSTGAVSTGFRDGTQIATGSYALNTLNTVLYVGARTAPDFSPALYCPCVFAEIIILDKVLTLTDRQALEGYFAWKWGAL